ncbi:phosphoribosylformylglycinamidine cyclo-ligase [Candidatus Woesearchaeota archaeon]|nr:phosphoribosylformylglycinamidine cyclo-ligase [Candidatus Woesearchaeota archaeon]
MSISYKDAGVDIDAGNKAVDLMKKYVKETYNKNVMTDLGSFGGLFSTEGFPQNPVLVSSCDGVGTKLKIAYKMDKHDTIGQDLVNHCVNDILVMGARPLFFLDYIGTGKMDPDIMAQIVKGFSMAAKANGCAIVGGESAEMPGIYQNGEYDVAGFIVGVVDKEQIITGEKISSGDILIGLPSNGFHTNGYTLVNKIFFEKMALRPDSVIDGIHGTIGEELLKTHKSYLNEVTPILPLLNGMAHITGGGFYENIKRVLPEGLGVEINADWEVPEVFKILQKSAEISDEEMHRTFNMGIGMVLIVPESNLDKFKETFLDEYNQIGKVTQTGKVHINFNN